MDLPSKDEKSIKFITNVGLITSDGPIRPNVMSAEWTHHISYSPGLIAVCIWSTDATHENIRKTREFGVNLCAVDQPVLSSVAGGYTGRKYDKIKALKELGFEFYKAKKIKVPIIKGAAVNIECKLIKSIPLGGYTMFVGEVVEATNNPDKEPLAYHKGRYWLMNTNVPKPSDEERQRISNIVEKYKK